jgi:hypothetical protein
LPRWDILRDDKNLSFHAKLAALKSKTEGMEVDNPAAASAAADTPSGKKAEAASGAVKQETSPPAGTKQEASAEGEKEAKQDEGSKDWPTAELSQRMPLQRLAFYGSLTISGQVFVVFYESWN